MPSVASSVRGLPVEAVRRPDTPRPHRHDGAHPSTAAVCRHLLGDAFQIPVDALRDLERALAS